MSDTDSRQTERSGTGADVDADDRPTVLVVDDEPNVAKAYALWLGDEYETRTAEGGTEALEKMDDSVAVVLLDRRMPGMSGDEVLEEIREAGYDVRVAMVTAVDPDFDIVEMPFDAYVTKPVKRDELVDVVEELLSLRQFDESAWQHFALAEKRATLEAEKTDQELAESATYQELVEKQESLPPLSEQLGEMSHEMFQKLMEDFDESES